MTRRAYEFGLHVQSANSKIWKQANTAFDSLLDNLRFQIDHAACLGLPEIYAEKAKRCVVDAAIHALASGVSTVEADFLHSQSSRGHHIAKCSASSLSFLCYQQSEGVQVCPQVTHCFLTVAPNVRAKKERSEVCKDVANADRTDPPLL